MTYANRTKEYRAGSERRKDKMRVNIYAEEMTSRVELITKTSEQGEEFTGVRFYLELPVTLPSGENVRGPFVHHKDDDDAGAVTFWGKHELRIALIKAIELLDKFYMKAYEPDIEHSKHYVKPVQKSEATYKINKSELPASALCECGHTLAAHGSSGMMCSACSGIIPATGKPAWNHTFKLKEARHA